MYMCVPFLGAEPQHAGGRWLPDSPDTDEQEVAVVAMVVMIMQYGNEFVGCCLSGYSCC